MDDEEIVIEYDRDIKYNPIIKIINSMLPRESVRVRNFYRIIETVRFDRNKIVEIDGMEYRCKHISFLTNKLKIHS